MKKILFSALLSIGSLALTAQMLHCGDQLAKHLQENTNPGYLKAVDHCFQTAKRDFSKNQEVIYTIPVVVHLVYNSEAQNLPDEVVHDQIAILNRDFRRMNEDAANTRDEFLPVAGDAMIEFALASEDPWGSASNGITRTQTDVESFIEIDLGSILAAIDSCDVNIFDPASIEENIDCITEYFAGTDLDLDKVKRTVDGGIDPWDTQRYLNIWVCNMGIETGFGPPAPFILGFAYPPLEAPNWEGQEFPENLDDIAGVVMHYEAFGSNNPNPGSLAGLNDMGRTCVHEVGHYLGLRHIWGDGECEFDDGIADTPAAAQNAQTNTTDYQCTDLHVNDTCLDDELPDMIENYMDYSPESCQNMFTLEQIGIMRAMLEGPRSGLLDNPIASIHELGDPRDLRVFPNPFVDILNVQIAQSRVKSVELWDMLGHKVSVVESDRIDLNGQASGYYLLKVFDTDHKLYIHRVLKL